VTSGAAQAASVLPRLARPPSGWRLRIQPQVSQDLPDHRPLEDGRNDLQLATAVRAVLGDWVGSALQRWSPDQAVVDLPFTNVGKWPAA